MCKETLLELWQFVSDFDIFPSMCIFQLKAALWEKLIYHLNLSLQGKMLLEFKETSGIPDDGHRTNFLQGRKFQGENLFEYFKQKTHFLRILSDSNRGKIVLESIKLYNRIPRHLNLKITEDSKILQQSLSYTAYLTK